MSRLWKRFIMLLVAVVLPISAPHDVTSAPALTVEDQLRCTFPLPGSATNICSFLLFSTEGAVSKVSVQVRQVKTPDGASLPLEAAVAGLAADTITTKGVQVTITLDPKFYTVPGEYRIILFFQAETGNASLASTVVINRPAADINIDELKDQTIALTRWFPFPLITAHGEFPLYVRESSGKIPISDLGAVGQSIYVKDTKELAPGTVTATLVPDSSASGNIPAGGVKTLKVNLADLSYAGAFDTRLLLTSPNFSGGKTIPVKVTVQDFVLWPLLAITIGVVGGFLTRRLVGFVNPKNQNELEILRLQNEIDPFREVVKKPASIETIQTLLAQLRRARESNEIGDFAAVKDTFTKVRDKFEEFRKAQVQAEGEAQVTLNGLVNQVEVLEQSGDLTNDEIRDLHSIKDNLADIERLLRLGMVEDAQIKIENVKPLLTDLRTRKFANYFTQLKDALSKLTPTPTEQVASETLKIEIQAALNSNDLDKVRLKLEDLKTLVETIKNRPTGFRGSRETGTTVTAPLPEVPGILPELGPFTHIEIGTPPAERIAGTTIGFTIVDTERIIQRDDQLRWFFGDVGSFETNSLTASHNYSESDRFQVRVEIIRSGALVKTLSEIITILPGQIEQVRASILRDMARNEIALSVIALVLAIIGGVLFLYSGKLFGSLVDYLMAILWGFGLDNSIKGFAAVLSKLKTT